MSRLAPTLLALAVTALVRIASATTEDCPEGYRCEPEAPVEPAGNGTPEIRFDAPPPPPQLRRLHAVSLRLTQMLLSDGSELESTYLTGVGLSFRVRPVRWLGVEPAIDLLTGYDQYDAVHSETHISTDLLFYLNPRDAVQVFGLTGGSIAFARHSEYWAYKRSTHLGAHMGLGLEFRVTHLLSFNVNAVAFSRTVTAAQHRPPEQGDTTRAVQPSSAGMMLRGGTSVYF